METSEFKPFIPADKKLPELTVTSIITGVILAVVFGAANAYLGLRVGMTVSASIPAAVISMGVIRMILKRDSILENNIVQTIGSAGESLAAGAIFTLPALFMWAKEFGEKSPSLLTITMIALIGGLLGVFFMIPLRHALIVKEHGTLPYPEGQACSEVLIAGEEGGKKAGIVFKGLGIAALYKFIADGLKLFPSEVDYSIGAYKGSGIGGDVLPALLGVGYICGPRVGAVLTAGGFLAWFVLMPLFVLLGGSTVIFPATVSISEVFANGGTWGLWSNYIRYVGAGALATAGIISLIKNLPLIAKTFAQAFKGFGSKSESNDRLSSELPMNIIMIIVGVLAIALWLIPSIPVNFVGAIIIIIFGFFFATVSSRMVGIVGSSNNPVSGMAIATLLIATIILKATGKIGFAGMTSAISIGSIICIIAAIAGDTSQDLKTGYIIGSTPKAQQIGEVIGVAISAITIGGVLYLLNAAWGYGSSELPAPQATLMKLVVEGIMSGNLPWNLVFVGVAITITAELIQIPSLVFAIGLYLPIHLSLPILIGGLVRWFFERKKAEETEEQAKARATKVEAGVLYSSGLIAGEGIVGILLAVFAVIKVGGKSLGDIVDISGAVNLGNLGGIVFFALLIVSMCLIIREKKTK
ncbi:MAG: oligopeptide transporter, OPT family [Treponema sp.]|nr:oligopeptide transporter, OPT family [Treponema sp.]